jgi:hypothetical protein
MLNKSIIDANKAVTSFVQDNLPQGYEGLTDKITYPALIGRPDEWKWTDGWIESELRLYKRPRGDKLLSIKNLGKIADVGDVLTFDSTDGVTVLITVTKGDV